MRQQRVDSTIQEPDKMGKYSTSSLTHAHTHTFPPLTIFSIRAWQSLKQRHVECISGPKCGESACTQMLSSLKGVMRLKQAYLY